MRLQHSFKLILLVLLTACGSQKSLEPAALSALYAQPLAPPDKPMRVFHIGHSLVGSDMPAMLEQLAGPGHDRSTALDR